MSVPCWRGVPVVGRPAYESLGEVHIRATPDDFRVDEMLGFEPDGCGEHVFLQVRKVDANTAWVARELARASGLTARDVSYAGRKDRHAVTTQWFSCWLPRSDPDFGLLDVEGVTVLRATRHARKLRRGEHTANRFALRVSGSALRERAALAARLERLRDGFPNYFAEQRFGFDADNLSRAERFFARPDRRKARKHRDRDLFYSAARAFLFNRLLDADVSAGSWLEGDATLAGDGPMSREDRKVLVPFAALIDGLALDRTRPGSRARRVVPVDLEYVHENGLLQLSFELPAGSYATAMLRELGALVDLSGRGYAADREAAGAAS